MRRWRVPIFRNIRPRPRLSLRFQAAGNFSLTQDGESWTRDFGTLAAALQYFQSLHPAEDARLTFFDSEGNEIDPAGA